MKFAYRVDADGKRSLAGAKIGNMIIGSEGSDSVPKAPAGNEPLPQASDEPEPVPSPDSQQAVSQSTQEPAPTDTQPTDSPDSQPVLNSVRRENRENADTEYHE